MSLKTSFFNKTLFKANLKRFWWVSAAYVVMYLIIVVLPMLDYSGFQRESYIIINILSALSCALLPAIVFSYLNSSGSVTCMHAFPIKRRAHFTTGVISAYSLILIPMLIMYFISLIYMLLYDTTEVIDVLEMFLSGFILMTVAISGATLGSMVTGNTIAAIVFGGLFIGFPFYTELILKSFLELNVYGIWSGTQLFMFEDFRVDEVNGFMLGYFAVNIALFIVSGLLYEKRRLETNGDIISFNFLKPIFVGCVAVFFGFLGYFYLYSIYRLNSIFYMLPFGIVGVTVSYMLSKNAFTFKGIWKPYVMYVLAVAALFAAIRFDITGFERRVPEADEIASVDITGYSLNEYTYSRYIDGKEYYMEYENPEVDYLFTDREDIENVIKLHRHLIKEKNNNNIMRRNLPVIYTLKNGKTVKREYYTVYDRDKEVLAPVYRTEQMKKQKWEVLNSFEKNIVSVSVTGESFGAYNNQSSLFEVYTIDDDRAKALIDALYKDIENISFEKVYAHSQGSIRVTIDYISKLTDKDGNPPPKDTERAQLERSTSFVISPEHKNTVALLTQYGLYDKVINIDKIKYAKIRINGERNSEVEITDRNDIKELYDYSGYYEWTDGNIMESEYNSVHYVDMEFYDDNDVSVMRFDFSGKNLQPLPMVIFNEAQKYLNTYSRTPDMPAAASSEAVIVEQTHFN